MKNIMSKSSVKIIIGILIITAVVVGAVQYVKYYLNKENIKNMQADMLLVQAKVEIVKANYSLNKEEHPLVGYQLTVLPEGIDIKEFLEKNVIAVEEYEKYYLLDNASLEQMDLKELVNKYKGYFIVNYDNYDVIYTEGYENENKMWCYRISDLHKMPEKPKADEAPQAVDGNEQSSEEQNQENAE